VSVFATTFAVGRLVSGPSTDYFGGSTVLGFSLLATSVFNVGMGITSSVPLMVFIWLLNGFAQGLSWPAVAKILHSNCDETQRGTYWSGVSMSTTLAFALMAFFSGWLTDNFGHTSLFFLSASSGFLSFIIFVMSGINDNKVETKRKGSTPLLSSTWTVATQKALLLPLLLNFWINFIRSAYGDWGVLELKEAKRFELALAGQCHFWHNVGGMIGTLSCGYISDKYFRGNRKQVIVIYSVLLLISGVGYWVNSPSYWWNSLTLFFYWAISLWTSNVNRPLCS